MKNAERWLPSKFEQHHGRWRGSRDAGELGIGSRLISDLVAGLYPQHLPAYARGRRFPLGYFLIAAKPVQPAPVQPRQSVAAP